MMLTRALKLVLAIAVAVTAIASLSAPAHAQDAHYWTDQWGTRANLLGGVVIGSVGDLSSTYYNPGFFGLGKKTQFIIATKVYQVTSLHMPSLVDDKVDLGDTRVNSAPDFIAGEFTFGWLHSGKLAYSLLTRESGSYEIKGRFAQPATDGSGPQSTLSSGEILTRQSVTEIWGGVTYAEPLGKRFGLGATLYGAYRTQRLRDSITLAQTDSMLATELISGTTDGNYWNGRVLMKFGLAWEHEKVTAGLNYTTPSVSLLGSGSYYEQEATPGVEGMPPPYDNSYQSATDQENLDARYKSGWAVGFGASYLFDQVRVHFSGEYHGAVDSYLIMQGAPWYPQTGGPSQQRAVYQLLESVFNWGVGVEVPLSKNWYSYASFITDHSAAPPPSESVSTLSTATWDTYQISAGAEITFSKGSAMVGLSYAFANDSVPLESPLLQAGSPLLNTEIAVRYRRIKAILGFSIQF